MPASIVHAGAFLNRNANTIGMDCQYAKGYLRRFPEEAGSSKPRRFGAAGGAI